MVRNNSHFKNKRIAKVKLETFMQGSTSSIEKTERQFLQSHRQMYKVASELELKALEAIWEA